MAYNLKRYEYWLHTERFDITAEIPEGATREQFRLGSGICSRSASA
jgi:uncharacterized protein (TIGR03435 family)